MMYVLHNSFHGTSYRVRLAPGAALNTRQCADATRALCGVEGCCCSRLIGTRGPQDAYPMLEANGRVYLVERGDLLPSEVPS